MWVLKIVFAKAIFFRVGLARIHTGPPIKAFRYHFIREMSKQIKDISFLTVVSNSAHKGSNKIQLLTYSCNVQRAVEVKVLLKSKRESEKKRELDNRNLVHVIILHNAIKHLS